MFDGSCVDDAEAVIDGSEVAGEADVGDDADELDVAVEEELDNGAETSTVTRGDTSIIEYPVVVTVAADSVVVVWMVDINVEVLASWVKVTSTV